MLLLNLKTHEEVGWKFFVLDIVKSVCFFASFVWIKIIERDVTSNSMIIRVYHSKTASNMLADIMRKSLPKVSEFAYQERVLVKPWLKVMMKCSNSDRTTFPFRVSF